LLPRPYLQCRRDGAYTRPTWLEPRHDAWLRTAIEAFDACAGYATTHVADRGQMLAVDARRSGLSETVAAGVWHVIVGGRGRS
jgi:hypothetical protein